MNNGSMTFYISPFKKGYFEFNKLFENKVIAHRSINTAKLLKNHKHKDFFYKKQRLLLSEKQKIFSSRNKRNNSKNVSHVNSAIIKKPKASQINILSTLLSKTSYKKKFYPDKKDIFKNKPKRNYSAYYINSDLRLKKNYISDLLQKEENNNNNSQNKSQKISDIEKKISILEKSLNIININNTNKSNSFFAENSKYLKIKKIKNYENEKKKVLPDYLKEKFNIKGTNILSPFCMKSRDNFIMEKFRKFLNKNNTLKTDKKYIIDNKLNIIYAENEEMYKNKLKKINQKLIAQGKRLRYKYILSPSEKQLRDMEKKVTFMKDLVDVAFPNTAMFRLRDNQIYLKKYKTFYKKHEALNDKKINYDDVQNNFFEIKVK